MSDGIPSRSYPVRVYETVIHAEHLDTFGHVNNAEYLRLFEEARWQAGREGGFTEEDIRRDQLAPTLLEAHLRFVKEVREGERVRIETQVLDYPGKVGTMRQAMVSASGDLCCEATFKFGLFDLRARKLVLPTAKWLKAVGAEG